MSHCLQDTVHIDVTELELCEYCFACLGSNLRLKSKIVFMLVFLRHQISLNYCANYCVHVSLMCTTIIDM